MNSEGSDRRSGLSEVISPTTCVGQPVSAGESAQGTQSVGAEGSIPSLSTFHRKIVPASSTRQFPPVIGIGALITTARKRPGITAGAAQRPKQFRTSRTTAPTPTTQGFPRPRQCSGGPACTTRQSRWSMPSWGSTDTTHQHHSQPRTVGGFTRENTR